MRHVQLLPKARARKRVCILLVTAPLPTKPSLAQRGNSSAGNAFRLHTACCGPPLKLPRGEQQVRPGRRLAGCFRGSGSLDGATDGAEKDSGPNEKHQFEKVVGDKRPTNAGNVTQVLLGFRISTAVRGFNRPARTSERVSINLSSMSAMTLTSCDGAELCESYPPYYVGPQRAISGPVALPFRSVNVTESARAGRQAILPRPLRKPKTASKDGGASTLRRQAQKELSLLHAGSGLGTGFSRRQLRSGEDRSELHSAGRGRAHPKGSDAEVTYTPVPTSSGQREPSAPLVAAPEDHLPHSTQKKRPRRCAQLHQRRPRDNQSRGAISTKKVVASPLPRTDRDLFVSRTFQTTSNTIDRAFQDPCLCRNRQAPGQPNLIHERYTGVYTQNEAPNLISRSAHH